MSNVTWYSWDQMPREAVSPMLDRKFITGNRMMLAHVYLKKGCVVPRHQHENEQLTYILEGALKFWIGEDESQEVIVRAGEVLHIPSNVFHKAEALEDTLDVDIFDPPRQDWLNKTDAYLRKKPADLGLRGKVALVAASSKGLGLATARELAAEGASLAMCARGEAALEAARRDIAKETGAAAIAIAAAPVSFAMSRRAASSAASPRAHMASDAPSAASSRAVASPSPLLDAATSATLPRSPKSTGYFLR